MMKLLKAFTVLGMTLFFASCASAPPAPKAMCPEWTTKGAAAFPGNAGKSIYGVGMASGIKNPSLLRETADNRAIANMAKQFQVDVASLMNDYMASTSEGDKVAEEQHVENVNKIVVKQTLSGVVVVDRCTDTTTGVSYSLAKLDTEKFKTEIEKNNQLSQKMKEYVKGNAEKAFEKLEKATGGQ